MAPTSNAAKITSRGPGASLYFSVE